MREQLPLAEALDDCACTTGPTSEQITLEARSAEIRRHYPAEHVVVQALEMAAASIWRVPWHKRSTGSEMQSTIELS